jgi:uncharacterized protein (DUF58 family)
VTTVTPRDPGVTTPLARYRRDLRAYTPRPTRRGLGGLAVLVGLLVVTVVTDTADLVPLLVAVGLPCLIAPVSASVRAGRARAGLVLNAVVTPPTSAVGGEITLLISVTNRTSRPSPGLSIESPPSQWRQWRPGTASTGTTARLLVPAGLVTLPSPGPRSSTVATSPAPATRRGLFVLPSRRASVLDPFGLWGAPGPAVPSVTVVVHPEPDPRVTWPPESGDARRELSRTVAHVQGRDGPGDLVGIRPYVAGDRLSLLHWPARARYGTWFVRQFASEIGSRSRLVLDDRLGVHRKSDFERMLRAAEQLVEICWRDGRTVELCTLSGLAAGRTPPSSTLEEAQVLLATVLPGATPVDVDAGGGVVLTTATGARSLPDGTDRIVVDGTVVDRTVGDLTGEHAVVGA